MSFFTLRWVNGGTMTVEGNDLVDACRKAGINMDALQSLAYYYDERGVKVQVSGQADCGCVYRAEEGSSCPHDLKRIGF